MRKVAEVDVGVQEVAEVLEVLDFKVVVEAANGR